MKRNISKTLGLAALLGCAAARPAGRSVSIAFFNYTDRYLGDVSVDGAWVGGGDAYGMGGYAQGLLSPSNSERTVVLKVKWIVADVYDVSTNKYSRRPDELQMADVQVSKPYPQNPDYLVLHFYSDGHVEAELEAGIPRRRIPKPAGYLR